MWRRATYSVLLVTLGVTVAAAPPEPPAAPALPSAALPPELERVLRDYERAWAARDAAGLAALFAEDGFVLANHRPPARGTEAIRQAYAGAGGPLALRALAHATQGDVGWIVGAFAREKGADDMGKFVLALRRGADGRWLIAADMDNANRRPPPPSPPVAPAAPRPPEPPGP
jgi:ketosteroid isomerase-like protein